MSDDFVLTRVFNAPRALVWKAWTDRDALTAWMGPKGTKMVDTSLDLRPGGMFHYAMQQPDGALFWGKWTFVEITPMERLIAIVAFSDAQGGVTRHPLAADWPAETHSTATSTDQGDKTLLTLRWRAYNASEKEQALFDASHDGMNQGWAGTMEQLDAYLAQVQR